MTSTCTESDSGPCDPWYRVTYVLVYYHYHYMSAEPPPLQLSRWHVCSQLVSSHLFEQGVQVESLARKVAMHARATPDLVSKSSSRVLRFLGVKQQSSMQQDDETKYVTLEEVGAGAAGPAASKASRTPPTQWFKEQAARLRAVFMAVTLPLRTYYHTHSHTYSSLLTLTAHS